MYPIIFPICVILTGLCCLFAVLFLTHRRHKRHIAAFWLKGGAGLCFLSIGTTLALIHSVPFSWLTVAGLFFGLLGDQALALRKIYPRRHSLAFLLGALSFAVGHILYIAALQELEPTPFRYALPLLLLALAGSGVYALIRKPNAGKLQFFGMIYIGIVALMFSFGAATLLLRPSICTALFALGSVLFLVSDNLLTAYTFGNHNSRNLDNLIHLTYYGAQLLIAWSLGFL